MSNNPFHLAKDNPHRKLLDKRKRQEVAFKTLGLSAVLVAFAFLAILLVSILSKGFTAFFQTQVKLNIEFSREVIDPENTNKIEILQDADYSTLVRNGLNKKFSGINERSELMALYSLPSKNAANELRDMLLKNPALLGTSADIWLTAAADVDMYVKGKLSGDSEAMQKKSPWIAILTQEGSVKESFNSYLFTRADSREAEQAGLLGSIIGSFFTILCCMVLSFPLGILTAIYLEEFAPKNRLTDLIEVNINNLAAVPSIVFGLLGLAIYIHFFGIPRSSALAGGLTLSLLTLPIIVITTRNSIKAIPPSIKDAALALGASKVQTVVHHIIPLAMPGIMTGTILSVARALGETAPLLMIGMVAFVADLPSGLTSPSTALPVQVYLWADSPEIAFAEKTSAAIMVLLLFLVTANALAVYLRKKFEVKW